MHSTHSDIEAPHFLASIVATIGPASESPEAVRKLISAGVGVFRFNFSHGEFAMHQKRLDTVRAVARDMGVEVACLGDLQGPKIRVGKIPATVGKPSPSGGGMIEVKSGEDVVFKAGITDALAPHRPAASSSSFSPSPTSPSCEEVQPGHQAPRERRAHPHARRGPGP